MYMRYGPFIPLVLAGCGLGLGCDEAKHVEQNGAPVEQRSAASTQEAKTAALKDKISRAGIAKYRISSLKSGAMRDLVGDTKLKGLVVWNGAGRRLYPSIAAAQADGFAVLDAGPAFLALGLDEELKQYGGYSDDFLVIYLEN